MPVDQGQPNAALSSLSNAAEESEEQQANDGLDAEEESTDRVEEAVAEAAEIAEETGGLGELGRPGNRRPPFFIGRAAGRGVAGRSAGRRRSSLAWPPPPVSRSPTVWSSSRSRPARC